MKDTIIRNKDAVFTIPNLLTMFRLCLIPVILYLYIGRQDYTATTVVLLVSAATDIIDGFIARHFHMTSNLGKILDPVADKLTQGAMLISLVSRFKAMYFPLFLMIVKELFAVVTGCMLIHRTKKVHGADWHGKVATAALYIMMTVHVIWVEIPRAASDALIGTCVVLMLLSFALYAIGNIRRIIGLGKDDRAAGTDDKTIEEPGSEKSA